MFSIGRIHYHYLSGCFLRIALSLQSKWSLNSFPARFSRVLQVARWEYYHMSFCHLSHKFTGIFVNNGQFDARKLNRLFYLGVFPQHCSCSCLFVDHFWWFGSYGHVRLPGQFGGFGPGAPKTTKSLVGSTQRVIMHPEMLESPPKTVPFHACTRKCFSTCTSWKKTYCHH